MGIQYYNYPKQKIADQFAQWLQGQSFAAIGCNGPDNDKIRRRQIYENPGRGKDN